MQDEGYDLLLSASDYKALKSQISSKEKIIRERDLQNERLKVEVMRVMSEGDKKTKICKQMQVQCAKEIFKLSLTALQQQTDLTAQQLIQKRFTDEVKQFQSQIEKLKDQNQEYVATMSKIDRKSAQYVEKLAIAEQKCTELQAQNQSIMLQLQKVSSRNIVLEQTIEQTNKVNKEMQDKVRETYAGGKQESSFGQFSLLQSEKEEVADKARMEQNLQQTEESKRNKMETEKLLSQIASLNEVNLFLQKQNSEYQHTINRYVDVNTIVQNSRKLFEGSKANLQVGEWEKKDIKKYLLQQKNELMKKIQEVFDDLRFQ